MPLTVQGIPFSMPDIRAMFGNFARRRKSKGNEMRRWLILGLIVQTLGAVGCANPFAAKKKKQQAQATFGQPLGQGGNTEGALSASSGGSTWLSPFRSQKPDPYSRKALTVPASDPTSLKVLPASQVNTNVYLQAGKLAGASGNADTALGHYQKVIERDPKNLEALVGMARAYDRKGQFKMASQYYVLALNAHPQKAALHNDFGICCSRYGQHHLATSAFSQAIRIAPRNTRYRNNLAKSLVLAGRSQQALEQLRAAHPPAAAHYNFAYLMQQQGETDQALFHLRQALRHDPTMQRAQQLLQAISGQAGMASGGVPQPGMSSLPPAGTNGGARVPAGSSPHRTAPYPASSVTPSPASNARDPLGGTPWTRNTSSPNGSRYSSPQGASDPAAGVNASGGGSAGSAFGGYPAGSDSGYGSPESSSPGGVGASGANPASAGFPSQYSNPQAPSAGGNGFAPPAASRYSNPQTNGFPPAAGSSGAAGEATGAWRMPPSKSGPQSGGSQSGYGSAESWGSAPATSSSPQFPIPSAAPNTGQRAYGASRSPPSSGGWPSGNGPSGSGFNSNGGTLYPTSSAAGPALPSQSQTPPPLGTGYRSPEPAGGVSNGPGSASSLYRIRPRVPVVPGQSSQQAPAQQQGDSPFRPRVGMYDEAHGYPR